MVWTTLSFSRCPLLVVAALMIAAGVVLVGSSCAAGDASPATAGLVAVEAGGALALPREVPMPKKCNPYPVLGNKSRLTCAPVKTKAEWLARREYIREHILVGTGLYLTPPKCPLKPKRLDRKQFDGFVREKIYFESYPGVLVTGALYTPADAEGKLPGVLCPHGHWKHGRLEEPPQARCINFAKQGYVVLAIDMVGYNDNGPITHQFKGDGLWGLSLGGLQLWNCIRSLDLLGSLDTVDPERIGVTGASGGGTQTFMVSAVEERVKVAAPVCMISAHFQGGCLCENAPLMRISMNNMEIGAAMSPRPLVLVSATGDWTKNTPSVEYPAIRWAYELMGATDKVSERQFNLGHNYDKVSREVVYSWFARWLKGKPAGTKVAELPYKVDDDLRIFGKDRERPAHIKSARAFVDYWREMARKQLDSLRPTDSDGLARFDETFRTALRHTFSVENCSDGGLLVWTGKPKADASKTFSSRKIMLGLKGRGSWLAGMLWTPSAVSGGAPGVLIVHPKGVAGVPESMVKSLTAKGRVVLAVDCLPMGRRKPTRDRFYHFYNRSNLAVRVQEIMMGLAALDGQWNVDRVDVVGLGKAGPWTIFARALSDATKLGATIIDGARFDERESPSWRKDEMFNLCIMRYGGTSAAGALIAPGILTVHNTGGKFQTRTIQAAYKAAGAGANLDIRPGAMMTDKAIVDWLVAR